MMLRHFWLVNKLREGTAIALPPKNRDFRRLKKKREADRLIGIPTDKITQTGGQIRPLKE